MRAAIFIDGGYLLNQTQDAKVIPDYSRLADYLLKPLRQSVPLDLMRCYFYYCAPWVGEKPTDMELRRMAAHERFVADIHSLDRWQVRLGKLERRREGDRETYAQKRVDVQLSVDLVHHTAGGHVQHVILMAGDSDFIPAIIAAKEAGATLTLWCDRDKSVHKDLLVYADEVHYIDWQTFPTRQGRPADEAAAQAGKTKTGRRRRGGKAGGVGASPAGGRVAGPGIGGSGTAGGATSGAASSGDQGVAADTGAEDAAAGGAGRPEDGGSGPSIESPLSPMDGDGSSSGDAGGAPVSKGRGRGRRGRGRSKAAQGPVADGPQTADLAPAAEPSLGPSLPAAAAHPGLLVDPPSPRRGERAGSVERRELAAARAERAQSTRLPPAPRGSRTSESAARPPAAPRSGPKASERARPAAPINAPAADHPADDIGNRKPDGDTAPEANAAAGDKKRRRRRGGRRRRKSGGGPGTPTS